MTPTPLAAAPRPASPTDLFLSCLLPVLQGLRGAVAIVQRELVERKRWLTQEQFLEHWAVARVMPAGPARHPLPRAWCAALGAVAFVLVALLRVPLIFVLIGVGGTACVLCYLRLKAWVRTS